MCCRQIHKHRNTKAKVHLNTRERVGESLTSSTLSNFSKYLCLSKIPKKTFSWQSIFAMIPTAISLTLQELIIDIKQDIETLQLHIKTFNKMCPRCLVHDLEEIHSNLYWVVLPVVGIAEELHKDIQCPKLQVEGTDILFNGNIPKAAGKMSKTATHVFLIIKFRNIPKVEEQTYSLSFSVSLQLVCS